MLHIRQKQSSDILTYTVVKSEGFEGNLENHPSMLEHPDLFEIVDCDIPEDFQFLNYSS